jgi:signal transduction histidine kinase
MHRVARPRAEIVKRRVQVSLLTLLILLALVLVTGVVASVTLYRSAEDHYIRLALPLRSSVRDVLFQMEREETGVRGYVITGDRDSLRPYFAGRDAVGSDLVLISRLTRERPLLADRVTEVRREVRSLHGFYDRLIAFVADGRVGQARARREVLDGELLAEQFRRTAATLQADADALVAQTRHDQHATFVRTLVTLGISGMLALAVGLSLLTKLPERLRRLYASEEDARLDAEQGANASRALAHVSDAVLLVDDDGTVRFWNAAAEHLLDVNARRAVGRAAQDLIPEYERLVEAARGGEQFVPVSGSGGERWLTPSISTFEGGSVLTLRDATAGYVLERVRSDFVATASHELRTPLTAVFGGARTLTAHRDELPRHQQDRLLRMIEQESEQLVRIVDQLLVSAQLDRGTLTVDESATDVGAVCSAVVESARVRAAERNLIMLQMPTAIEPLRCDEALLRQVLVNLVENAVKYSDDGDRIDVIVADEPTRVRIDVVDHGIGIPPAEQERIFEKFYRLDAAMTRGVGGSGLGLYISREIVQRLDGSLAVRSEPGEGSTFSVTLPRAAVD